MSNVIKVQNVNKKVNLRVNDPGNGPSLSEDERERILTRKIQEEYNRGFAEGEKATIEKLKNDYELRLQDEKEKFADMVVSMAMAISKKVIKREIEIESPLIENIKSVSKKLIGSSYVVVKVHPDEYDLLNKNSNEIFTDGSFSKLKIEADSRIEKGGFTIESDIGNIDGQITSQIDEVKKAIGNLITNNE